MSGARGKCPQCGRPMPAAAANPYRPFCSDRCRLLDLGDWLDGRRAIPGEEAVPEPEHAPPEEPT